MERPCFSWYRMTLFVFGLAAVSWNASGAGSEVPVAAKSPADEAASAVGVSGGLCVQIGAADIGVPMELAATGRFLVHVLDEDEKTVGPARQQIGRQGRYGLISVDRLTEKGKLPYAENLVNLLVIRSKPTSGISAQEVNRVLVPNGVVLAAPGTMTTAEFQQAGLQPSEESPAGREWLVAKKPRPAEMDDWPNPRHGADGNAVSRDTLVGPPRRIRWITAGGSADYWGPVSAAGRNFYLGTVARDAFNGLRLWHRDGAVPMAANDKYLFVKTKDGTTALDAVTGRPVHRCDGRGWATGAICDGETLIVYDHGSVRALRAGTADKLWEFRSARPRGVVAADGLVAFVHGEPRIGGKSELVVLD